MAELDPFPRLVVDRLIVELAESRMRLSTEAEHAVLAHVWRNTKQLTAPGAREQEAVRNTRTFASKLQQSASFRARGGMEAIDAATLDSVLKMGAGLCPGFWPFC